MSFSYKLYSHYGDKFPDGRLLVDHLRGVSEIALDIHRQHGIKEDIEDVIRVICMCHDFGKASCFFQDYLKGKYYGELKNHGEISAYFAYYMLPEKYKLLGFICVKRHHGDMDNGASMVSGDAITLQEITGAMEDNIEELNYIYGKDISEFFRLIKDRKFIMDVKYRFAKMAGKFSIEDMIWMEYIWSLLLTADKTQLIRGTAYENKVMFKEEQIRCYKDEVRRLLKEKKPGVEKTELFSIRENIYNEIIEGINEADITQTHKFSINVPTGTGKTLGVYGAAFALMERLHGESNGNIKPSLIYSLPFTSVIDQNYYELEKVMEHNGITKYEDLILKHHSMTELRYRTSESDEYKDYDARFCVENWQSTIITTTFVQLFNTIFKIGDNSIGNRFHKLAGSVVILDEVQAVDPKFYKIIETFFDVLCKKLNTYVILVTATKPILLEGIELVKNNEKYFRSLNRIKIENHTDKRMGLTEFHKIVEKDIKSNADKSFLIVMNTVKSSLATVNYLKKKCPSRKFFYLSTEIYPKRRLEIINIIKNNNMDKFVLVSTQLIEAGVDIDFDIVYRDFSTLDSINQTAGRGNRNGIGAMGVIKLYTLIDEGNGDKKYCNYIYPLSLLDITRDIFEGKNIINESDIFEINRRYFGELNQRKSDNKSEDIAEAMKRWDFEKIRKLFELIEDNQEHKVDLIVNINDETQECIDKILGGGLGEQDMINCWRKLNQYKISVNKKELKDINDIPYEKYNMRIISKDSYDIDLGVKREKYRVT
ncbi:MAG TPA: CRISPR-associated helicase Cas3' [Sedimentibacter sp.]|nr:CRISPR-associated helicase Cas3' [Sedimentibacter sp.]